MAKGVFLTVLTLNLGNAGNVTSAKSKRGSCKQVEHEEPQEKGVRLEGSHDCEVTGVVKLFVT